MQLSCCTIKVHYHGNRCLINVNSIVSYGFEIYAHKQVKNSNFNIKEFIRLMKADFMP